MEKLNFKLNFHKGGRGRRKKRWESEGALFGEYGNWARDCAILCYDEVRLDDGTHADDIFMTISRFVFTMNVNVIFFPLTRPVDGESLRFH